MAHPGPLLAYEPISAAEQDSQDVIDRLRALGLYQHIPRACINSSAPACTLPFEVLARIFVALAALERPSPPVCVIARESGTHASLNARAERDSVRVNLSLFSWFKVTHVCRTWRNVALADGRLWGDIQFWLGRRWAEEMISRSHFAPLHIRSRSEPGSEHAHELLSAHFERIGTIDVNFVGRKAMSRERFKCLLSLPAPMMETVCLVMIRAHVSILPREMFLGHAPQLRNLSFFGAFLDWDAPILDGASHMRVFIVNVMMTGPWSFEPTLLQDVHSDDDWAEDQSELEPVSDDPLVDQYMPNPDNRIPRLEILLDILDGMPVLEELRLEGVIPIYDRTRPLRSPRIIMLSCLTRLTLSGPLLGCMQLMDALDLPRLESLHLFCRLPFGRTSTAIAVLLPFLTKYCSRSNDAGRSTYTLEIRSAMRHSIRICALAGDAHIEPQSDFRGNLKSDHDIFNIEVCPSEPSLRSLGCILQTVLSASPLNNTLRRILVHGFERVSQNGWVRTLGHCTELREVRLAKATLPFIKALGNCLDHCPIFLPKLEILRLGRPHGDLELVEVLFQVLKERKRRGVFLQVLDLGSAWHTKEMRDEIVSRGLARVVRCDPPSSTSSYW